MSRDKLIIVAGTFVSKIPTIFLHIYSFNNFSSLERTMKINLEKRERNVKEICYRILIFLPSPIIFAKRPNPSSLHQPLISRGEYTVE